MLRGLVLPILLLAAAACSGGARRQPSSPADGAGGSPRVVVQSGGLLTTFRVELARTDQERERGLMYREHLDPDAGMLFLFDAPGPLSFWMKNTFIPLDMLFIGPDHRVVGIVENATPRTLDSRSVAEPSQYVLELNGGTCSRLGIRAGASVDFLGF